MSDSKQQSGTGAKTPVHSPPKQAPPSQRPALESAHTSRCGRYHSVNQDCCLVLDGYFYGVADGVGGGDFGEVASRALLDYCAKGRGVDIRDPESLRRRVRAADIVVRRAIDRHRPGAVGASTLVCAWLEGFRGRLLHVGDARACRLRFGGGGRATLQALTEDQTYGKLGESPPRGSSADDPARMVGVGAVGDPPTKPFRLQPGDILLLSSDGLHRYANPAAIIRVAEAWHAEQQPLRTLAERLETLALGQGSHDDITILLVRRNPRPGFPMRMLAALFATLLLALAIEKVADWHGTGDGPAPAKPAELPVPAPPMRPLEIAYPLRAYYPELADWISIAIPPETDSTLETIGYEPPQEIPFTASALVPPASDSGQAVSNWRGD